MPAKTFVEMAALKPFEVLLQAHALGFRVYKFRGLGFWVLGLGV